MGYKLPADGSIPTLKEWSVGEGVLTPGCAVVAEADDGYICEGNVEFLLPWGCEWFDKDWKDCTVVIRDHEDGHLSNWDPRKCTAI